MGNLSEVATGHGRVDGDIARDAKYGLKFSILSGKLEIVLTPEIPSMEAPPAGGEDGTNTFFGDEGIFRGAPPALRF